LSEEAYLAPDERFGQDPKRDAETRVREGVKAVLEEVLREEMTRHLSADHQELTLTRPGERNARYYS
jgi:transposase-like protein